MGKWIIATLASCAVMVGQTQATDVFDKAPPEMDSALRARVAKFFQAHVDAKFRQAEEVIAEDSKDFFYNMEKQRYFGFEIVRINYSENFTRATVVTGVELEWRSPRVGVMRVKPPLTSLWRFENGQWFWYVVPQKDWETPWGRMNPGPDASQNKMMALFKGVDVETVRRQVEIDTNSIMLKGYESSKGSATIANGMPGDIQLRLTAPSFPGLKVTLDKPVVKSGEKATILLDYTPETNEAKPATEVVVSVEPTAQVFRIKLTFDVQPEIKKLLPKELQK